MKDKLNIPCGINPHETCPTKCPFHNTLKVALRAISQEANVPLEAVIRKVTDLSSQQISKANTEFGIKHQNSGVQASSLCKNTKKTTTSV